MIRVLALYSQCKQLLTTFTASAIDYIAAKRLAFVLKALLGLEAILKLAISITGIVSNDGELLIYLHKTKLDISTQFSSSALAPEVPRCAEKRFLQHFFL